MRALIAVVITIALSIAGLASQDPPKPRIPKSGDTIVVTGCLRGSMLEATAMSLPDEEESLPAAHTFQLKGKKELLKDLRAKHDGHLVEVTGVLKSRLTETGERGAQLGNTRIVVGADSSIRGGGMPGTGQAFPVLEAKSFEGSGTSCRR
jgi:hypothetical protein